MVVIVGSFGSVDLSADVADLFFAGTVLLAMMLAPSWLGWLNTVNFYKAVITTSSIDTCSRSVFLLPRL
jgi:hypothetical protein